MKYLFTITTDEGRNYFEETFTAANDGEACEFAKKNDYWYAEGTPVESCTDLQDLKFDQSLICELLRIEEDGYTLIASQYTTCPAINSKVNDWVWLRVDY